jgi:hypothetical protein
MNSSSNRFRGNRFAGLRTATFAALVACAGAGVATTSLVAPAAERRREPCGREQLACADAASAAAGRQPGTQGEAAREKQGGRDASRPYGGQGGAYDFGFGYGRGQGRGDMRSPRQHEWEETQAFMQRYASRRHAAIEQMPDGESKESMKRFWFARVRSLQSLQRRDPAGYEQRLTQLRIEDQIFGVISDWTGVDDADREQLRDTLRGQVTQLVDLDLQERQRRVEWLKKELADQSEQLDKDRKQHDALVDKRVARFADWAGRLAARRRESEAGKGGAGDAVHADKQKPDAPADKPDADKKRD